ncbi:MAG: C-GCAxxG-C-C family protein [Ignavibacteria bacterium]|nr:C-GCAxxG-C-C family protein [Ignavibacteria bacterium]
MNTSNGRISSMRTVGAFINGRACSDTLFHVLNNAFDSSMPEEECAVMPFAGGIMQHGYQCGMIWGAALAAGARAFHLFGVGPEAEARAIVASKRLVESFRKQNGHTDCSDITALDKSSTTKQLLTYFLLKGGTVGCFRMAARYAPVAYREIDAALSDQNAPAPPAPVSCAAETARMMGASDMQAVMAAGLAGGIGLSGGACGALGTALWISGMESLKKEGGKLDFKSPAGLERIETFLQCTDYEFECSKICGRKFESVDDHGSHVRQGGCAHIMKALAAKHPPGQALLSM